MLFYSSQFGKVWVLIGLSLDNNLTCPWGCAPWASKIWSQANPWSKPKPSLAGNYRISHSILRVRNGLTLELWKYCNCMKNSASKPILILSTRGTRACGYHGPWGPGALELKANQGLGILVAHNLKIIQLLLYEKTMTHSKINVNNIKHT